MNNSKWKILQDRDEDCPELNSYTITLNENYTGWNTDSGYDGYGLPKELAEWICETLNTYGKDCPFTMCKYGIWERKIKVEIQDD